MDSLPWWERIYSSTDGLIKSTWYDYAQTTNYSKSTWYDYAKLQTCGFSKDYPEIILSTFKPLWAREGQFNI